jgi:hypothetical protein
MLFTPATLGQPSASQGSRNEARVVRKASDERCAITCVALVSCLKLSSVTVP